jgi:hypothetical protein
MRTQGKMLLASILAAVILTATASAQQAPSPPPTTPYGAPIGLEAAQLPDFGIGAQRTFGATLAGPETTLLTDAVEKDFGPISEQD